MKNDDTPRLPRRVMLAGLSAAFLAGGSVYLATLGQVTAPATQTFRFARGTAFATGEEERLRAYLLEALRDDRTTVVIAGHSGTSGDPSANQSLSEARADIAARIAAEMGIAPDRMNVVGLGGDAPLPRPEGTPDRTWQATLARVEVTLQVRR